VKISQKSFRVGYFFDSHCILRHWHRQITVLHHYVCT